MQLGTKEGLVSQEQIEHTEPMEKEVDAIIDVLSYFTREETPFPPRNLPKDLKKF